MELSKHKSVRLGLIMALGVVLALALAGCANNGNSGGDQNASGSGSASSSNHLLSQAVVTDPSGTTTIDYTYDDDGNITKSTETRGDSSYDTSYSYNDKGEPQSIQTSSTDGFSSTRTYGDTVVSGDTTTYNWTVTGSSNDDSSEDESFTGSTTYTTADNGARCVSYQEKTTFNDGNASIVTMEFDDKGLVTKYISAIEGPDDTEAEVTYDYKLDGKSGTVTVNSPMQTYTLNMTCDDDGHPTLLEDKESGISIKFAYDATAAHPTDLSRVLNQPIDAAYFTNIPMYFVNAKAGVVESTIEEAPAGEEVAA